MKLTRNRTASAAAGFAMHGMIESPLVRHINAQCQSLALYLHKPSGMRYAASLESAWSYELNPLYGHARHATLDDLADTEVWQRLI
jgi:hypothetical protein